MSFYYGGKMKTIGELAKRKLAHDPRSSSGRYSLVAGLVFGLVWLSLLYIQSEQPWLNGSFVLAIGFTLLGVANILPQRLRGIGAVLRAMILIFLLTLSIWIISFYLGGA